MPDCKWPDGIEVRPGGIDLDPCIYEDIEAYKNVTVIISRCQNCGHIEISWKRQSDTEEVDVSEIEYLYYH